MTLDPQAQAILDIMATVETPPLSETSPEAMRKNMTAPPPEQVEQVAKVENRMISGADGDIPARIYWPSDAKDLPILVYYHGGGFVVCDLETHDGICRALTNKAETIVVSVDYRLAPEHKFPAGPEDCYAATKWVSENASSLGGDASRLSIGGDSAGGNFAAVVALMAKERGGPSIDHQILLYPVTDNNLNSQSYLDNAEGYFLTREMMGWFWGHYVEDDGLHPHASPLRADDLSGLPRALVITAQYDPLRDEGQAYAKRLVEAGVDVEEKEYAGMIHGFATMIGVLDQASDSLVQISNRLKS